LLAEVTLRDLLHVVQVLRDHGAGQELSNVSPDDRARIDADGNGRATVNDVLTIVTRIRSRRVDAEPELALLADDKDDPWEAVLDGLANDVAQARG
jgi:hypothetical protein